MSRFKFLGVALCLAYGALSASAQAQSAQPGGLGGFYDTWSGTWLYNDPSYGPYNSFNYVTGVTANLAQGKPYPAGIYAHFKTDAALGNALYTAFTIDAFDENDRGLRPFYLVVPHDLSTQASYGGVQLQNFNFNSQDGSEVMRASMVDRAFYMVNAKTLYDMGELGRWSVGMGSAGQFMIGNNFNNYSPAISIKPLTMQVTFGGPVQLASFAPSALPAASAVGAGSMVYLTSGQIAYSDGASWNSLATGEPPTTSSSTASAGPPTNAQVAQVAAVPGAVNAASLPDPVTQKLDALNGDVHRATGGVAAAMALGGVFLPPDKHFAVSFNLATFAGERGFAASAVGKVSPAIYLNAGIAGSTAKRSTGGRVGITFGW